MRRRPPIHFDRLAKGRMSGPVGNSPVRMSTAARLLRDAGCGASADELERDAKAAAPWCQQCQRATPDPVVALLGDRVAFACPHCSSPEILAKWESEAP